MMIILLALAGCQDQLEVSNPNAPTPESARSEDGIIAFAMGSLYAENVQPLQGFIGNYHERMGDEVATSLVPVELYTPDKIILDDNSELPSMNKDGQKGYLRQTNIPGVGNATVDEWTILYRLIGSMNAVLENVETIAMRDGRKNTIKAWAYFWKGFAYSRIGSMYYAGIITDQFNTISNKYVSRADILVEAEKNFILTDILLDTLSLSTYQHDYEKVIEKLIPSFSKMGKGFPPSTSEWKRNINTLRARNILINTPATEMTGVQWDQIFGYASNGVQVNDNTFTLRTYGDQFAAVVSTNGYVAAQLIGPASNGGGGNKVSERLIQDFKPGDNRFANNFVMIPTWIGPGDRGNSFNTRFMLVNQGNGMPGVVVLVDRTTGAHELYVAGFYEENVLMLAEANIYKGNIDAGLAHIDELRNYQGAGLPAVAGTGLTPDEAKEELRRERRVGLAFRGFSFYDARRWGVLQNGRTGCVVVGFDGVVSTNATIQYGFMDYWDVPIAESFYNKPSSDSAPTQNPN